MFPAFVREARRLFPEVRWLVFAGPAQPWTCDDPGIEVSRLFPANDRPLARLWADHCRVPKEAARRGAYALLTVGFVPVRGCLPTVMHVFTLHHERGSNRAGRLRSAYRSWALNSGLRRAVLVVTNSRWAEGELAALSSNLAARMLVSPEGVDHARFHTGTPPGEMEELTKVLGLPLRYLLWASNFYPYKRAELALAAYARLPAALRAAFPFVLAGGDWEGGLERARREAARFGLGHGVRFLGWVDDLWLPALLRNARAHVMASAEETFGRTVLEAMACGCPCVLQDLPVLREVTGGAAEFVDFADAAAASAALGRICTDDELALRLRHAGLHRANGFSFTRLARERMEAILRVLQSKP